MSDERARDPGQYIGHEPELAADRIPGGVRPDDERVAAHSTQSGPKTDPEPAGHRERDTGEDEIREAGQDR
jgi:hypothetical protein